MVMQMENVTQPEIEYKISSILDQKRKVFDLLDIIEISPKNSPEISPETRKQASK